MPTRSERGDAHDKVACCDTEEPRHWDTINHGDGGPHGNSPADLTEGVLSGNRAFLLALIFGAIISGSRVSGEKGDTFRGKTKSNRLVVGQF